MKPIERFDLISKIGRHLQSAMTTTDINVYLKTFGVKTKDITMADSKWVYVKELLSDVDEQTIIRIAQDLGLEIPTVIAGSIQLKNLLDGSAMRVGRADFEKALQDIDTDPPNAIGMASTTLESICKAILDAFE